MVQIEKAQTGGAAYLNKKAMQEKGVKTVIIKTEPKLVDVEYEGKVSKKLECICSTNVLDPAEVTWQMNATTQNFLIDKFGNDTALWVGKEIELAIKQAGQAQPGIYPAACSLEKVIA
jgi:hypothetical protein